MANRILCSHNFLNSWREPRNQTEDQRENNVAAGYKCGSCCQLFSAICVLHSHLGGGSYHYDKDTVTAYPLDENGCPTLKYIKNQEENQNNYCVKCGDKLKRTSRKRKSKTVSSEKDRKTVQIQIFPSQSDGEELEADREREGSEYRFMDVDDAEEDLKSVAEDKDSSVCAGKADENDSSEVTGQNVTDSDIAKVSAEVISQTESESVNSGSRNSQEPSISENISDGGAVMTKEVTVNIISLETSSDGSLKLVVSEEDAGIFQSPHGEEIMKALKKQAKGMKLQNTQIVCTYRVPVGDNKKDETAQAGVNDVIGPKSECEVNNRSKGNSFVIGSGKKMTTKRINQARKEAEEFPGFRDEGYKGIEPIVFMRRERSLKGEEVSVLLEECKLGLHDGKISKIQPVSAKGGEVYCVDLNALAHKKDVKHDKYVWRSYGNKRLPTWEPRVVKHFFRLRLPDNTFSDDFQKHIVESLDEDNNFAIIHYLGDETAFIPFPHGNCKRGTAFRRTCPSVLEELKQLSKTGLTPSQVYKVISNSTMSGFKGSRAPRNFRQVKNHMYFERKKERTRKKNENGS